MEIIKSEIESKNDLVVIIPIYNEESCINELIRRLLKVKEKLDSLEITFVFVNDGSIDQSLSLLVDYAKKYSFIKIINLSRNFGHQLALTAGLNHVDAEYVVMMDADLQDPPELVVELYKKAKEGYEVVYAKRKERAAESRLKLATASFFYKIINMLSNVNIPSETGDFRLIDRKVLNALKNMPERNRFLRGMIPWVGFKAAPIYYNRDPRFAGETKYTWRKMISFAADAIFSFSNTPLRIASFLGLLTGIFGALGGVLIFYLRFFTSYSVPGISAVIFTIIFMGGVQIVMIGIVGEYIGRIFDETKSRPLHIIDRLINFDTNEQILKKDIEQIRDTK